MKKGCFLCGDAVAKRLTTVSKERQLYIRKQVQLFQTYLSESDKEADKGGDIEYATCAKCCQDVKLVWELNQEIEARQRDITHIVERFKASKQRREEGGATFWSQS